MQAPTASRRSSGAPRPFAIVGTPRQSESSRIGTRGPFRGRKQRELSGQRLPLLDDPAKGEPSGLPFGALLDGDGREDRVGA